MGFAYLAVAVIHALAAACWLGAMFYSLTVLHPRARQHFTSVREFEDLVTALAAGARYKVLAALGVIALTGIALVLIAPPTRPARTALIWAKAILFLPALLLFLYTSYRLWPARLFATDVELPAHHRRFRHVAITLTLLAATASALGVAAHIL